MLTENLVFLKKSQNVQNIFGVLNGIAGLLEEICSPTSHGRTNQ
nr:MAG TPA: hypothetical protein [Caudoviricetes sp.]